MEIFKVIGFVFVTLVLIIILKSINKDEFVIYILLISSVVLLTYMFLKLENVINILKNLGNNAGINSNYLSLLLKVTGISYVIEIAKNICIDSGSSSLASKVELMGKISIVILTIPIFTAVIEQVIQIL